MMRRLGQSQRMTVLSLNAGPTRLGRGLVHLVNPKTGKTADGG
jgi:hypothetical protein